MHCTRNWGRSLQRSIVGRCIFYRPMRISRIGFTVGQIRFGVCITDGCAVFCINIFAMLIMLQNMKNGVKHKNAVRPNPLQRAFHRLICGWGTNITTDPGRVFAGITKTKTGKKQGRRITAYPLYHIFVIVVNKCRLFVDNKNGGEEKNDCGITPGAARCFPKTLLRSMSCCKGRFVRHCNVCNVP